MPETVTSRLSTVPPTAQLDSPLAYWISKRTVWPQLSQIAFDLYSTAPCSDEPERIFSIGGNILQPRRRVMAANTLEEIVCLRNWHQNGIIDFETLKLFEHVVQATDYTLIAEELAYTTTNYNSDEGNDDSDD